MDGLWLYKYTYLRDNKEGPEWYFGSEALKVVHMQGGKQHCHNHGNKNMG